MRKTIIFFGFALVLAVTGCSSDDSKSSILVSSEATDCKNDDAGLVVNVATGETSIDEYVKYEATSNGYLVLQHINAQHGCDSKVAMTASVKDNTVTITENGNNQVNCFCLYDLSMKIGPLKTGRYNVVIYKGSEEYAKLSVDFDTSLKGEFHITK